MEDRLHSVVIRTYIHINSMDIMYMPMYDVSMTYFKLIMFLYQLKCLRINHETNKMRLLT